MHLRCQQSIRYLTSPPGSECIQSMTQSFIWNIVFTIGFLSIQYWIIKSYFSSSKLVVNRLNEFSKIDDLGYFTLANDHNQTTFLRIPSEDEESGGE